MIIPKYLQRPDMTKEKKQKLIAWIETKREKMKDAPTFDTESQAKKEAVREFKRGKSPSVWKTPDDLGRKYAVVDLDLREDAQISGYMETVDFQGIFDLANKKNIDEIDEV